MLNGVFIDRIMYIVMIDCKFDISRETCTKKENVIAKLIVVFRVTSFH